MPRKPATPRPINDITNAPPCSLRESTRKNTALKEQERAERKARLALAAAKRLAKKKVASRPTRPQTPVPVDQDNSGNNDNGNDDNSDNGDDHDDNIFPNVPKTCGVSFLFSDPGEASEQMSSPPYQQYMRDDAVQVVKWKLPHDGFNADDFDQPRDD